MKKFIKCLSFILMVGIICISLVGCKKDKADEEKNDNYLMCTENESNGINLKMKRLSNVSTQSTSGDIEIVAIVNPSDAVNKKLTWTLTWKTSKSDSISDYVTKSVSSDTLTCTLTYVKNFDTQIILKATSDANSSISATCTIDCYKRTSSFDLKLAIDFDGTIGCISPDEDNIIDFSGTYDTLPIFKEICFDFGNGFETVNKVGTIDTTTTITRQIILSTELETALTNNGITCNSVRCNVTNGTSFNDIFSSFFPITSSDNLKLALASTSNWFVYCITINDNITGESSYKILYQLKGFNYPASEIKSISFNNSSVIF